LSKVCVHTECLRIHYVAVGIDAMRDERNKEEENFNFSFFFHKILLFGEVGVDFLVCKK